MLNTVDSIFSYRFLIRRILIQKDMLFNNSSIIDLKKIIVFFSLKFIESFDLPENFNFFYFFRFFFGQTASVTKFKKNFKQGVSSFNYNIQIVLDKHLVYSAFFFILNDVIPFVDKEFLFLQKKFFNLNRNHQYLFFSVKDVLIFSEKKSNIGLFDLNSPLNFKLFFNVTSKKSVKLFLSNTKFFRFYL